MPRLYECTTVMEIEEWQSNQLAIFSFDKERYREHWLAYSRSIYLQACERYAELREARG